MIQMVLLCKSVAIPNNVENQSVKNAECGICKDVNERNELFEKNKQTVMFDEQYRTNKAKDKQSQERTDFGMNSVRWQKISVSLHQ